MDALHFSPLQVLVPGRAAPRFSAHPRRPEQTRLDEALEGLMKWHRLLALQKERVLIQAPPCSPPLTVHH